MNNLKFINKDRKSFEISEDDLGTFCADNELDIKAIKKVIAGMMQTHRGFRLESPKSTSSVPDNVKQELESLRADITMLEKLFRDLSEQVKGHEKSIKYLKGSENEYGESGVSKKKF